MPPLASVPDLEHELDSLYALPLAEFTKARNDLAARLKRAHQAEAALAVRALKKPTAVAWAANHLARAVPDQVASLHERGVNLGIDVAAVQVLPPPEPDSPARRVREPGVKPSRWRKLWDMITGADPKREDWSEEE